MNAVRPSEPLPTGKFSKPGFLGTNRFYSMYGADLLQCSKSIHGYCYTASKINLKNKETLEKRLKLFNKAIEYCDSIMRVLDLCFFSMGDNKKKSKSLRYIAKLTYESKRAIFDRINRDKLLYEQKYSKG